MSPPRTVKAAIAVTFVLAFCLWNTVFDRTIVTAGRQYVYAASEAPRLGGPLLRIDDWMRPARSRAVRSAFLVSGLFLAGSLGAIGVAARRRGRSTGQESTCAR